MKGRTAVIIASGPSLTAEDCELVRLSGHPTIVTNMTFRAHPWANAWFAFDIGWWRLYHEEVRTPYRELRNTGACSVKWVIEQGAAKVVLLGFDTESNGEIRGNGWPSRLAKSEIINCSRVSVLTCFPRRPIEVCL